MGVRATAAVWYDIVHLPPTAKLVLLAIADHMNDESGWAWPSVTRLATMCNIHPRNVRRWIDHLEEAGHIEIRRRPGWANHYRLTTPDAGVTTDASAPGPSARGPLALASKTGGGSATQTRRTRREPGARATDAPTPTPPPLAVVLAQQDQYR